MGYFSVCVGEVYENAYVFFDDESKRAVIIDPGAEAEKILDSVNKRGLTVEAVLLTHGHYDHTGGAEAIRDAESVDIRCHADEKAFLLDTGKSFAQEPIMPDALFNDGDDIPVGGQKLRVIHTPGHTAGSCCFYAAPDSDSGGVLFSGDTLFRESVGRHDLPTGNGQALLSSVKSKLYTLPGKTVVCPGHGEASTIAHEMAHNPFVKG